MALIELKAKVELLSEEDLELASSTNMDLGNVNYKSRRWKYCLMGFEAEDIKRVIQFSVSKTLVLLFTDGEDEKVLVEEPFKQVFEKWQKAREYDREQPEETPPEETTENPTDRQYEEDEDD